jgi:threonine synthase
MLFHSTRGKDNNKTFEEILMQGLAKDGGLFMPDYWPEVDLDNLKNLDNFIDVAKKIVPLFTDSSLLILRLNIYLIALGIISIKRTL